MAGPDLGGGKGDAPQRAPAPAPVSPLPAPPRPAAGRSPQPSSGAGAETRAPRPFDRFYLETYPGMVRLARVLVDSPQTAEDLVQDAFVRMHRHWGAVRDPEPYLRRCVVNACRSHHRRLGRERRHTAPPPAPGGDRSRARRAPRRGRRRPGGHRAGCRGAQRRRRPAGRGHRRVAATASAPPWSCASTPICPTTRSRPPSGAGSERSARSCTGPSNDSERRSIMSNDALGTPTPSSHDCGRPSPDAPAGMSPTAISGTCRCASPPRPVVASGSSPGWPWWRCAPGPRAGTSSPMPARLPRRRARPGRRARPSGRARRRRRRCRAGPVRPRRRGRWPCRARRPAARSRRGASGRRPTCSPARRPTA